MRKPALRFGICLAVIAAALFARGAGLPFGGSENSAEAAVSFKLPWKAGVTYAVNQTWNSGYHTGYNLYAYDFGMPKGAAVLTSAPGTVTKAAYGNKSGGCGGSLNEVHVTHSDGSRTVYMHLNDLSVSYNQQVVQGQLIGHVGCTGFATGPHLHFQRDVNRAPAKVYFAEYPGQQLRVGQRVTSQNGSTSPPPTVVVDDRSVAFSLYGPSQYWLQYGIGYGSHMFATWNNGPCSYGSSVCPYGQDVNYAVWRPSIPSTRNYRVCAYIPADHAYTTSARYKIGHSAGTTTVTVNQQPLIGWVSLGVFRFNAGTTGFVRLGDWTGETFATRQIGFDAIKWVGDGGGC